MESVIKYLDTSRILANELVKKGLGYEAMVLMDLDRIFLEFCQEYHKLKDKKAESVYDDTE